MGRLKDLWGQVSKRAGQLPRRGVAPQKGPASAAAPKPIAVPEPKITPYGGRLGAEAAPVPVTGNLPIVVVPVSASPRVPGRFDALEQRLVEVFTPSSPIESGDLLQGRQDLLATIRAVLQRKGGHLVIFGERGVGKTSLVKVAEAELIAAGKHVIYESVNEGATFESIAGMIQSKLGVGWASTKQERGTMIAGEGGVSVGVAQATTEIERHRANTFEAVFKGGMLPFEVANRLIGQCAVIILDDFELMSNDKTRAQFATLAKNISDKGNDCQCHLVLVGVGESARSLGVTGASPKRVLDEIHVHRLTNREIRGIAETGFTKLGFAVDSEVYDQIVHYSANYPYYTHRICEGLVRAFIDAASQDPARQQRIVAADMPSAIQKAIDTTNSEITEVYDSCAGKSSRAALVAYAIAGARRESVKREDINASVNAVQAETDSAVYNDLKRMVDQGLLKRVETGYYAFADPLMRAYTILRFRRDTPIDRVKQIDAALASIDENKALLATKGG